ncbi:MAG: SDR family oxidoreductase [Balneolaceae bacterium]|nr:SDR family oxidoreductase [Balneolaceae bacterium]
MKHAFVTGASRGIGFEIAGLLLQKEFRVTGTARKSTFDDSLKNHPNFTGVRVDLSSEKDLQTIIKPVIANECPDILINNAGIFREADFSVDDESWLNVWDETMLVNLRASSLISKWFINRHLERKSKGIIINITSRAAYRGDTQEYAAYAASKGGMVAFTKSIARDFSRKGIVAYSIAPGFVETDMAKESISVYGEEYLTKDSAFDVMTQPDEVARLALFLAEGNVKHMSGSTFHINGGSYMI